jgi:hypothetical protein
MIVKVNAHKLYTTAQPGIALRLRTAVTLLLRADCALLNDINAAAQLLCLV